MGYHVYAIELDKKFAKSKKAREANPARNSDKPCVYVGYTSKTPKERFKRHMSGQPGKRGQKIHSNIVYKYGIRLMPGLYKIYNPIRTKEEVMEVEVLLAKILRLSGYIRFGRIRVICSLAVLPFFESGI